MAKAPKPAKIRKIVIERIFKASQEEMWKIWTTKKGIESWWGPEGFSTKVRKLDLRPNGKLNYLMTATGREQIAFMKDAGMPVSTPGKITFSEVIPMQRLSYTHLVDFVPGLKPYRVETVVEIHSILDTTRMVIMIDSMHNKEWTERAVMGFESQLGKLAEYFPQFKRFM